jgi:hypothetical protein
MTAITENSENKFLFVNDDAFTSDMANFSKNYLGGNKQNPIRKNIKNQGIH